MRPEAPTMPQARAARDVGMGAALAHALSKDSTWSDTALAFLQTYAKANAMFVGWYVTQAAELAKAVPAPPTRKAWGSIFTKAARMGWIEHSGDYRKDPNRHANPCPVWRSLIFKAVA